MANHYEIPPWAGKPPVGLHLDVLKGEKLIQKLMIDEKLCYLFGRNPQLNDICIDHSSCSRVHAALVHHRNLNRAFLVDLGSIHGTFIGHVRLEPHTPTQLLLGSRFHFGASTRVYVLRERPQNVLKSGSERGLKFEARFLGLLKTETALDNLTEFNTAHNKRICMIGIADERVQSDRPKKKPFTVRFACEEEIINLEDIDPTIGKFRNLIHTDFIPNKEQKGMPGKLTGSGFSSKIKKKREVHSYFSIGEETPLTLSHQSAHGPISAVFSPSLSVTLGLHLPSPAPDVDLADPVSSFGPSYGKTADEETVTKKKYAKETWPGKNFKPSWLE